MSKEQYKQRMLSFQTKNKKLSHVLTEKEHNHLRHGLKYCFIDSNTNVTKYLSAEHETLKHWLSRLQVV